MCVTVYLLMDIYYEILGGMSLYLFCIAAFGVIFAFAFMITRKGKRLEYIGIYFMTYLITSIFCMIMLFPQTSKEEYLEAPVLNKIRMSTSRSTGVYAYLLELNINDKEKFEYFVPKRIWNNIRPKNIVFVFYKENIFGFKVVKDVRQTIEKRKRY
ncbi:hypothetical protein [Arcobacter peruensis]|uniref:hypothetical protein n=1 Tax=Arcobacter peruensis TaxID=2320140 RepID=UPI0013E02D65|nr:hypothetical protein [Arcobacter peruensis]